MKQFANLTVLTTDRRRISHERKSISKLSSNVEINVNSLHMSPLTVDRVTVETYCYAHESVFGSALVYALGQCFNMQQYAHISYNERDVKDKICRSTVMKLNLCSNIVSWRTLKFADTYHMINLTASSCLKNESPRR